MQRIRTFHDRVLSCYRLHGDVAVPLKVDEVVACAVVPWWKGRLMICEVFVDVEYANAKA